MSFASRAVGPSVEADDEDALKVSGGIGPLETAEPGTAALGGHSESYTVQQPKAY